MIKDVVFIGIEFKVKIIGGVDSDFCFDVISINNYCLIS